MALQDNVKQLRDDAIAQGKDPVPAAYQGVTKDRITAVLREIDRYTVDQRDAVFALLDDVNDSFYRQQYKNFPAGIKFCEGATVAHVGCHLGILQRGEGKSDREGRDYWLKPLWEIGAIEKVFFDTNTNQFIAGHPVAKSPYTAYRLAEDFKMILHAPEKKWRAMLREWIQEDKIRQRLGLQARLAEASRQQVDTKHSDLIRASCEYYYYRYYDPSTSRYVTSDPIGLRGGLNTYGYAEQNPIVSLDPLGLATWTVRGITSGSLVVGAGAKGLYVELESECQNGKKYFVNVTAVGPAAGLGFKCKTCFTAPANFSFGSVFTDPFPNADPSNLNGGFLSVGAGIQLLGYGGEYSQIVLGQAISPLSFSPAIGFGTFGADITGAVGTSTVTDVRTEDCGCE